MNLLKFIIMMGFNLLVISCTNSQIIEMKEFLNINSEDFSKYSDINSKNQVVSKNNSNPPKHKRTLINSNIYYDKTNFKCSDLYFHKFNGSDVSTVLKGMRYGKITNIIPSKKTGSTVKFTIYLKYKNLAIRTFFKPKHQKLKYTNPKGEVGAFIISEILKVRSIPPAYLKSLSASELLKLLKKYGPAPKAIQFEKQVLTSNDKLQGAMIFWIYHVRNFNIIKVYFNYIYKNTKIPSKKYKIVKSLTEIMIIDYLTLNNDRFSGGNILIDNNNNLYFIDNGAAFGWENYNKIEYMNKILLKMKKVSAKIYENLKNTPEFIFEQCLKPILNKNQIKSLLLRRKIILKHFKNLPKLR